MSHFWFAQKKENSHNLNIKNRDYNRDYILITSYIWTKKELVHFIVQFSFTFEEKLKIVVMWR